MALKAPVKNNRFEVIEKVFQHELDRPRNIGLSAFTFKLFFLIFLTALAAGFLAGFIRDNLMDIYSQKTSQNQVTNFADNNDKSQVLNLNFLVQEQDNAYSDVLTKVRAQVVGFYKAKPAGGILDSLYLEKDFLGSGVVVTSDGWLLTHQSVLNKAENAVVVTSDKKKYQL